MQNLLVDNNIDEYIETNKKRSNSMIPQNIRRQSIVRNSILNFLKDIKIAREEYGKNKGTDIEDDFNVDITQLIDKEDNFKKPCIMKSVPKVNQACLNVTSDGTS